MANTSNPFGLRWWGTKTGGSTYSLITKKIIATQTTAIYRGDVVVVDAVNPGYVTQGNSASTTSFGATNTTTTAAKTARPATLPAT